MITFEEARAIINKINCSYNRVTEYENLWLFWKEDGSDEFIIGSPDVPRGVMKSDGSVKSMPEIALEGCDGDEKETLDLEVKSKTVTFFTEEEELGLLEITEEEIEEAKKRLTARTSRNFKTQEVNEMTTTKTIRDCIEAFADSEYSQNSESFDEAMADEALKLYLGTLIELIKEKEATTNNEDLIKFILEKLESDKEQL